MSESLPQQRRKKYRKKVVPDEGLMSRLSMSGSTPVHISDLEDVADSGAVRRSSSSGRPGLRLIQRITALDFQPGPMTSTPLCSLVTEEVVLDLDNCYRN